MVEREVDHYGIQAVIAVGFKVNSARAVQFRKWINQIAKDYTIRGRVMDKERLMNEGVPQGMGNHPVAPGSRILGAYGRVFQPDMLTPQTKNLAGPSWPALTA